MTAQQEVHRLGADGQALPTAGVDPEVRVGRNGVPIIVRPGRALGEPRFDPGAHIDGAALAARVADLLRELSPRTRARLGNTAP